MSTLHNLTFYTIKNGARFVTAFCFVFIKVKGLLMHTELFVRRMMKKL